MAAIQGMPEKHCALESSELDVDTAKVAEKNCRGEGQGGMGPILWVQFRIIGLPRVVGRCRIGLPRVVGQCRIIGLLAGVRRTEGSEIEKVNRSLQPLPAVVAFCSSGAYCLLILRRRLFLLLRCCFRRRLMLLEQPPPLLLPPASSPPSLAAG